VLHNSVYISARLKLSGTNSNAGLLHVMEFCDFKNITD
jgi:hypothetical protein